MWSSKNVDSTRLQKLPWLHLVIISEDKRQQTRKGKARNILCVLQTGKTEFIIQPARRSWPPRWKPVLFTAAELYMWESLKINCSAHVYCNDRTCHPVQRFGSLVYFWTTMEVYNTGELTVCFKQFRWAQSRFVNDYTICKMEYFVCPIKTI